MHGRPLALLLLFATALAHPAAGQSPPDSALVPGLLLPIVAEHHYSVTARVRVLLFWYSRDNVGLATLRWRAGSDHRRGFELLIASDPERAPRRINQWGYVAEEIGPDGATLLGVGKDADPKSLEEAERQVKTDGGERTFLYKAIRTEVTGRMGLSSVVRLALPRDPTYRDVHSVIALLPPATASPTRYSLLPGDRPGYLPTIQEAVDECVAWHSHGRPLRESPIGRTRGYVYDGKRYELVVRSLKPVPSATYRGHSFSGLLHGDFVITNTTTGVQTRFQIDFPQNGAMQGVPVHVVYRPRWWFEVELIREDSAGAGSGSVPAWPR